MATNKLSFKGLAFGLGTTWGLSVLFLGWISSFGWGTGLVSSLSTLYIGLKPTFFGGIIGGIWAFVDGAIGGLLIAYFYNLFKGK